MSLGIGHFAVGATLTTLALWLLWPKMAHSRSIPLFGGLWAMVPDAGKLSMFSSESVIAFHDSTAANVFWGHRYLDVLDSGDSPEASAFALFVLLLVSLLAEVDAARLRRQRAPQSPPVRLRSRSSQGSSPVENNRYSVVIQRVVAVVAIGTGAVMGIMPLFDATRFLGVLIGTGTVLVLLGLDILLEDVQVSRTIQRIVPQPIQAMAAAGVSLVAGSFAVVLLSRVPLMTDLSIPYGALGFVLLVLLLRLWSSPDDRSAEARSPVS